MAKIKKVSLVTGENRKQNIINCLALIQSDLAPLKRVKNILIKPNLVAIKPEFSNTHVEAIEAVIEYSLENLVGHALDKIRRKFRPHGAFDIQKQWRLQE
jgi:uncharacterized protein (DUF362 family)